MKKKTKIDMICKRERKWNEDEDDDDGDNGNNGECSLNEDGLQQYKLGLLRRPKMQLMTRKNQATKRLKRKESA